MDDRSRLESTAIRIELVIRSSSAEPRADSIFYFAYARVQTNSRRTAGKCPAEVSILPGAYFPRGCGGGAVVFFSLLCPLFGDPEILEGGIELVVSINPAPRRQSVFVSNIVATRVMRKTYQADNKNTRNTRGLIERT